MTKKINVKIHKNGGSSNNLLNAIGNLNEGIANFSPRDLEGWVSIEKAYLPITRKDTCLVKDADEPNTFHISEDGGKTFTLSLEWVDLYDMVNDLDGAKVFEQSENGKEIDNGIENELIN